MGKEKQELVQHQQEQMKRNLEKLISGVRKYGNAKKDNLYTTYMLGGSNPELQKQATESASVVWEKFKTLADQGGELLTKLDTWKQNGYSAEEYKEIEETYNTLNQQVKKAASIGNNLKDIRDYAKIELKNSFKEGKYSKYGKNIDGNSVAILNISDIQMSSATVDICGALLNLNDLTSGMAQTLQDAEAEKKAEEELAEKKKQEELEAQKKAEEERLAQEKIEKERIEKEKLEQQKALAKQHAEEIENVKSSVKLPFEKINDPEEVLNDQIFEKVKERLIKESLEKAKVKYAAEQIWADSEITGSRQELDSDDLSLNRTEQLLKNSQAQLEALNQKNIDYDGLEAVLSDLENDLDLFMHAYAQVPSYDSRDTKMSALEGIKGVMAAINGFKEKPGTEAHVAESYDSMFRNIIDPYFKSIGIDAADPDTGLNDHYEGLDFMIKSCEEQINASKKIIGEKLHWASTKDAERQKIKEENAAISDALIQKAIAGNLVNICKKYDLPNLGSKLRDKIEYGRLNKDIKDKTDKIKSLNESKKLHQEELQKAQDKKAEIEEKIQKEGMENAEKALPAKIEAAKQKIALKKKTDEAVNGTDKDFVKGLFDDIDKEYELEQKAREERIRAEEYNKKILAEIESVKKNLKKVPEKPVQKPAPAEVPKPAEAEAPKPVPEKIDQKPYLEEIQRLAKDLDKTIGVFQRNTKPFKDLCSALKSIKEQKGFDSKPISRDAFRQAFENVKANCRQYAIDHSNTANYPELRGNMPQRLKIMSRILNVLDMADKGIDPHSKQGREIMLKEKYLNAQYMKDLAGSNPALKKIAQENLLKFNQVGDKLNNFNKINDKIAAVKPSEMLGMLQKHGDVFLQEMDAPAKIQQGPVNAL